MPEKRVDGRSRGAYQLEEDSLDHAPACEVLWPEPGEWESWIVRWFESLRWSGQARFYQQSDVETAYLWCEILNDHYQFYGPLKGQIMSVFQQACRDLLVTEGARRRGRVSLDRGDDGEAEVGEPSASVSSLYSKLKTG